MTTNADHDFGALLNTASRRLSAVGDRVLKPHKVTSAQWKVLVVLARNADSRVADLVEVLDHDQAAVSRLVTRMERAGLVRRRADPADARAGFVSLTAAGRKTYTRCDDLLRAVMNGLQTSFSSDELADLRRLLTKFTQAIDAELDRPVRRVRLR